MINLFIINGPDRKEYIVNKTVKLCSGSFDNIYVLDKTHKYTNELADVIQVNQNIEHKSVYQHAIDMTCDGDYLYLTDADEVPSASLIEFIRQKLYKSLTGTISVGGIHHYLKVNELSVPSSNYRYRGKVFFARKSKDIAVRNWGTHCGFYEPKPAINLNDQYYYIHYKHYTEISYGVVAKAIWHPESHGITEIKDCQSIYKFRFDEGLHNDTIIYDYISNEINKGKIVSLLSNVKNIDVGFKSNLITYTQNEQLEYNFSLCNRECCEHIRNK